MKRIGLAGMASLLLFLCSCSLGGGARLSPAPTGDEVIAESPDVSQTPAVQTGTNPLTGLPMEKEEVHNRPIAVMLNNIKVALPQCGVSKADLIYEVVAEGGITRMLGVFQNVDGVGNIGTVRSTRLYYLDLVQGLDAVLLHAGGSPEAYDAIKSRKVTALDCVRGSYMNSLFWRDQERAKRAGYEHSVFTSGETIQSTFATLNIRKTHETGYTYPVLFSDDGTPPEGKEAQTISVKFSNYKTGVFTYDPSQGEYLVSQYGNAYVDGNTNQQVSVENVLVLYTSISNIPGDTAGRMRVTLTGSGTGLYACNGKAKAIRWSKANPSSPFLYTYEDGTSVAFGKGKSYINIVSKSAAVSVSSEN
jgi:hypothetical protein